MNKKNIQKLAALIRNSHNTVFLTGSGVSTTSGIPDYRGHTSVYWKKYQGEDFRFQTFINNEKAREKYWELSLDFYNLVKSANPSLAHLCIAKLETLSKADSVITQNVDGLHQKATTTPNRIIEVHGTIHNIECLDCRRLFPSDSIYALVAQKLHAPVCYYCSGILKPAVLDFGQPLPTVKMAKALKRVLSADLLVVIGSSLIVQPIASLPVKAREYNKKIAIVNYMPTTCDQYADLVIYAEAGETLSEVLNILMAEQKLEVAL
ncbi:MAG: sigma factor regulator FecR [Deltaproteobacteria bacterium]|nr:sigma factor regulator FecR [Deltaproteobacteria bacterium]